MAYGRQHPRSEGVDRPLAVDGAARARARPRGATPLLRRHSGALVPRLFPRTPVPVLAAPAPSARNREGRARGRPDDDAGNPRVETPPAGLLPHLPDFL